MRKYNAKLTPLIALIASDGSGIPTSVGTRDYFSKIGISGAGVDLPAGTAGYTLDSYQALPNRDVLANSKIGNFQLQRYAQENLALAEAAGDSTRIAGATRYLAKLGFAVAILDSTVALSVRGNAANENIWGIAA